MRPRYAVRADHNAFRQYEVYSVVTGETVETFPYRTEMERATAHGRATAARAMWNENEAEFFGPVAAQ